MAPDLQYLHVALASAQQMAADIGAAGCAVLLAMVALQLSAPALGMWPYALITLPGTVAHELAHYVVALLLRCRPQFPSIIPRKEGRTWRLGSVAFQASFFRSVPVALAPVALAPLSLYLLATTLPGKHVDQSFLLQGWCITSMFCASLPSRQDWRLALPAILLLSAIFLVATFNF